MLAVGLGQVLPIHRLGEQGHEGEPIDMGVGGIFSGFRDDDLLAILWLRFFLFQCCRCRDQDAAAGNMQCHDGQDGEHCTGPAGLGGGWH